MTKEYTVTLTLYISGEHVKVEETVYADDAADAHTEITGRYDKHEHVSKIDVNYIDQTADHTRYGLRGDTITQSGSGDE